MKNFDILKFFMKNEKGARSIKAILKYYFCYTAIINTL